MINTWFTSDHHFGHKNIIEYEKKSRPFETVEEMNEIMIDRWNKVVKPQDKVYHLGDFAFGKKNIAIAERLNGRKILILGNHDCYPMTEYQPYFYKIFGILYWKKCILSHMPIHSYNQNDHVKSYGIIAPSFLNLHGHLHSKIIITNKEPTFSKDEWGHSIINIFLGEESYDPNYFNVSVEQNNLTPIHMDRIMDRLKEIY